MRRRPSRKSERGTTVLIVVMVTTLITAIGVFAVRNIAEIDRAVGYGRQAAQTTALAELATAAAMAQIGVTGNAYVNGVDGMSKVDPSDSANPTKPYYKCQANRPFESLGGATCFPLSQDFIEGTTTTNGGETLLEPTIAGTETGSFGAISGMTGNVNVEMTEKRNTKIPIPGSSGSAIDVTLTTTAVISPIPQGTTDPCGGGAAIVAVKKAMRAHIIVPSDPGTKP